MDPQTQENKTVLYISELPDNVVDSDIYSFFSDYKDNIIITQVDRNSKSFTSLTNRVPRATIIFKDHSFACSARNALNMRRLKGKALNIMWHEKDNSVRYNNTANIFIKGISRQVKPRDVYELFAQYGEIISSKICEDDDGNLLGYGYINYYNLDSAERAIKELNKKEFNGSVLEIEHFQKKNERMQSFMGNTSVYIKNIPDEMSEENVKNLFREIGSVTWVKMYEDGHKRKFAIVVYATAELAIKAKEMMNGKKVGEKNEELYVDLLQKKNERRRILNSKIGDINSKLNHDFKNCNLHVKNIPHDLTDEKLKEFFSQYGEIKSAKIEKYILVTKLSGKIKEIEQSRGFGFVCFTSPEAADKAINNLNNTYLPGYVDEKKPPLIINYFMPKGERKQFLSKSQIDIYGKFPLVMGPSPYANPNGIFPPYEVNYPMHRQPQQYQKSQTQQKQFKNENKQTTYKEEEFNYSYFESIETVEGKKEYLGEFLFKKIEHHPLANKNEFSIDTIGRITGMILGIEEIKEIYDIATNEENLTSRIEEAINLLQGQNEE